MHSYFSPNQLLVHSETQIYVYICTAEFGSVKILHPPLRRPNFESGSSYRPIIIAKRSILPLPKVSLPPYPRVLILLFPKFSMHLYILLPSLYRSILSFTFYKTWSTLIILLKENRPVNQKDYPMKTDSTGRQFYRQSSVPWAGICFWVNCLTV